MVKNKSNQNLEKIKIPSTPLPEPQFNLSRECTVVLDSNGQPKEFLIKYDDLAKQNLLGSGQFGTVTKMFHKESNMNFAAKAINYDLTRDNQDNHYLMDLKASLKFANQCQHLIRFYGALNAEGYIWILTEIMDASMDRFYQKVFKKNLQMTELFLSKLACSVMGALVFMKQSDVMHRDIKPSNILLNYKGEIKVCDFSISGFVVDSVCRSVLGCRKYMPPEKMQPNQSKGYNSKTDVWSFGISLIEIATGIHPFEGLNDLQLIQTIFYDPPPKLDETKFSPDLCRFVDKCLIKMPDDRSTCESLSENEFIRKFSNTPIDLGFIKTIIDEVVNDPLE
ncbi:dual specificity mitogen-activated kinase kinase 6 [Brachionus plicatilis]|uniref:mitogen-activated protein kinase kinase n=1 Tax=Brachionus plicatilis TaxID=10195 RepID=A0A3M7P800_BRAPC|nr:dual specificity mitogen-activated kinase kinase 6 [Brachionus plicatilis]